MGFIDSSFDFRGTPFKQADLEYARRYWISLIERVEPRWLERPKGDLAVHWQSDTVPSAVRLIDTAKLLYALAKSITKDSQATFGTKLKELLYSHGIQHEERFTELIVGGLLTRLGKNIVIEPSASSSQPQSGRPKSVDYGIKWPQINGWIYIESTVLHVQRIVDWEAAVDDLKRRFQTAVTSLNLNRTLNIVAPLALTRKRLSSKALSTAIRIIERAEQGSHDIPLGDESVTLTWAPAPHFDSLLGEVITKHQGFAFTVGKSMAMGALVATSVRLKWPGNAEELVNLSLRNSLDAKRRQFDMPLPYLLVMRLLSSKIPLEGVVDLLMRRIFNNKQYERLSAVGLLTLGYSQNTGFNPKVHLVQNGRALHPLPASFITALTSGKSTGR